MRAVDLGCVWRNPGYLDTPGRFKIQKVSSLSPRMTHVLGGYICLIAGNPKGMYDGVRNLSSWKRLEEGWPVTFGWDFRDGKKEDR
jgi:hypothetical protein